MKAQKQKSPTDLRIDRFGAAGPLKSVLLDSGAYSFRRLYAGKGRRWASIGRGANIAEMYESKEYKAYREAYLKFLRSYGDQYFAYCNLDVIGSAELTYANQLWFEKRGVKPFPVWHLGEDDAWLGRYVSRDYPLIAIGGMVSWSNRQALMRKHLDRVWSRYLVNPDGKPKTKVHAFGLTSLPMLKRYPWFSCDSTGWIMVGSYGRILVPKVKNGQWDFGSRPMVVSVTDKAPAHFRKRGLHFLSCNKTTRENIIRYLGEIGVRMGTSKVVEGEKVVITPGVSNHKKTREMVNAITMTRVINTIPWPRRMSDKVRGGGLL